MGSHNLSRMDANVQSKLLTWLENSCTMFIEKTLSLECRPLDKTIVTHVKNILGENLNNHKKNDLKFC
jgi:hypothetical protein